MVSISDLLDRIGKWELEKISHDKGEHVYSDDCNVCVNSVKALELAIWYS